MEKPVFISGLRKSGTSMVKNLLDGHPEIFAFPANEVHFFRHFPAPSLVKDKGKIASDPSSLLKTISTSKFIQRIGASGGHSDHREEVDMERFNEYIDQCQVESYPQVYEALFRAFLHAIGMDPDKEDRRFLSKTVLDTEFFPLLLKWFPSQKFVYVLRNPYGHFSAVRNSMRNSKVKDKKVQKKVWDLGKKAPYPYLKHEIERMRHSYYFMEKFSYMFPENFYVLVYDDLLNNPKDELVSLCDFLNISFDEALMTPTILGEPWGGNSWYRSDEFQGIDPSPLHHWKDDIQANEVKILNLYFRNIIEKYFYLIPDDGKIWKKMHPSEKASVYFKNRIFFYQELFKS